MNIMTKNILTLLLLSSLILGISACEKVENRVVYQGGTAPVLSTTATGTVVLIKEKNKEMALSLAWTNPNYMFNTGVNSQNVNYVLQIDTAGKNFASSKLQEMTIASDLGIMLTGQQFNAFLSKMEFDAGVVQAVDMRVISTLANGSAPLTSNSITVKVNPYLDFVVPPPPTGELYITGDATPSGWTNSPPVTQKFTQISILEYSITINLYSGNLFYKFLSTPGKWQPQYGGKDPQSGSLDFNMGDSSDPDAIPAPSLEGLYRITVNFQTGKYTLTKI